MTVLSFGSKDSLHGDGDPAFRGVTTIGSKEKLREGVVGVADAIGWATILFAAMALVVIIICIWPRQR